MCCNKFLGLWVVEKFGIFGEVVDVYVKEVIKVDFEELGDEDVFCKVCGDFDEKYIEVSDVEICE